MGGDLGTKDGLELVKNLEMGSSCEGAKALAMGSGPETESGCEGAKALEMGSDLEMESG